MTHIFTTRYIYLPSHTYIYFTIHLIKLKTKIKTYIYLQNDTYIYENMHLLTLHYIFHFHKKNKLFYQCKTIAFKNLKKYLRKWTYF